MVVFRVGMDPQIIQPSCYGLGREPFFSRAVTLSIVVNDFTKGYDALTTRDTYGRGSYIDRACVA
jgi:hypothetical protein